MKLLVQTFLFVSIFLMLSCKKKDSQDPAPHTNTGTGRVNYNGNDTLYVKAYDGNSNFLIQGNSIARQNAVVSLAVSFPKGRPAAGYYTPAKDSIYVSLTASSTLFWEMKKEDTITVTTSGNTLNVSFKNATFNLLGYSASNHYTGILTSN